jgi:tRNA (cytidine/uridine-2'-O-)-methyltransferase
LGCIACNDGTTLMLHVILYSPEIPPNTGNVIRLCANAGARLHLVHPLGFAWDDARVKRAGLDYHELANISHHGDWSACRTALGARRILAVDNPGATRYDRVAYRDEDALLFGQETKGIPPTVFAEFDAAHRIELPMLPNNRSLNLSNAVAVVVYEAWRQLGFAGARI